MRWALILILAAIVALWALAAFWPKHPPPIPERFVGTWELFRYEPPAGVRPPNPIRAGERTLWIFEARGAYCQRTVVNGYEIKRDEGVVEAGDDLLTLRRISRDRSSFEGKKDPWKPRWDGDHLILINVAVGDSYWLRRVRE